MPGTQWMENRVPTKLALNELDKLRGSCTWQQDAACLARLWACVARNLDLRESVRAGRATHRFMTRSRRVASTRLFGHATTIIDTTNKSFAQRKVNVKVNVKVNIDR